MENESVVIEVKPEIPKSVLNKSFQNELDAKLVSNKPVEFTMELSERMLNMAEFDAERPLRDNHVTFLLNEVKRGTFRWELANLAYCECLYDGKERRLNGHHTSWMRYLLGKDYKVANGIRILHYSVETEDDFRKLYSAFDRNAPRTKDNVLQSRLLSSEKFPTLPRPILRLIATGFACWQWGYSSSKVQEHNVDEVANALQNEHYQLALLVAGFLQGNKLQRHLQRSSIIGAMFATFSKAQKQSNEFWSLVNDGLGLPKEGEIDPRYKLRQLLLTSTVRSCRNKELKALHPEDMYRYAIYAWNAFRRGETLTRLILSKKSKRPAVI